MTDAPLFAHPVQPRESDERWTPVHLFDVMALRFDLDVCAPRGGVPWIPADRYYCAVDDGLTQPWDGLVWCNPPFSDPAPWVRRFVDHGNGVLLFPVSVSATWLYQLLAAVPGLVLLHHVKFVHPTHTGRHVPVGVAITALGDGIPALGRLADVGVGTELVRP